jgi:probable phosphoglycerate mutase
MTRLIVWRHGQTGWNATGRVQGHENVDLDEVGRRQASEAAPRLAELAPDLIVASDLLRATRTAEPLADLTGLAVRTDARLRERYFGPWQGLTGAEIREQYPDDARRWTDETITNPEIETVDDMAKRVLAAFRDVIDEVGDGTAVLVTHGGTARVGCAGLLGWPQPVWRSLGGLHNCHWADLGYSERRGWQLHAHNRG